MLDRKDINTLAGKANLVFNEKTGELFIVRRGKVIAVATRVFDKDGNYFQSEGSPVCTD